MDKDVTKEFKKISAALANASNEISKRVIGQDRVVEQSLISLLSGGHALLIGAPGLAKTRLVETVGKVMSLDTSRVQFTPDLMPSDILGSEILESDTSGEKRFKFLKGPVFAQLLMADEINRASPRTQSALLQAMQEKQVTIAGQTYDLPNPFHVLATQNPIEQEGTYPLPEAQLDRFLLQIDVFAPSKETERQILDVTTGAADVEVTAQLDAGQLLRAQEMVRKMPVGDGVVDTILNLVRAARPDDETAPDFVKENVSWGPGPRASQALMLACRARALLRGEFAPSIDDVLAMAYPVMVHRMALGFNARAAGMSVEDLLGRLSQELKIKEAAA